MAVTGCGSTALVPSDSGKGGRGGGGGAAGTGDGGASVAGVAGQGGASTAGAGGTLGGPGGAGGASSTSDGVACLPVTVPLITDFTYVPDAGSTASVHFGDDTTTFSGSEYVYPTVGGYLPTSDVTGNNWHIFGTIGDYSGFGLSFDGCNRVDASAYQGISFTISGSVASGNFVTMDVGTLNDTPAASWLNAHGSTVAPDAPGRCLPTSGTNVYSQASCADPTRTIPVTATPTTINVLWSDFSGGRPEASVDPSGILTIYWSFPTPAGVGTSSVMTYTVDITIDNLTFIQ